MEIFYYERKGSVKMENTKIKMRRQDREVTDNEKIKEIIKTCDCCRLGLNDNGKVYIVPLNFGFTEKNGKYTFYFHGARTGRKLDIIKQNNYAGFELDTNHKIYTKGDKACDYTENKQKRRVSDNRFASYQEKRNNELTEIVHNSRNDRNARDTDFVVFDFEQKIHCDCA